MNHKLLQFLLERDILDKYIINKANFKDQTEQNVGGHNLIAYAFDWKNTPEGYDYWSTLDDEYREYTHPIN